MVKKLLNLSFSRLVRISAVLVVAVNLYSGLDGYFSYKLSCDWTKRLTAEDFEQHSLNLRDGFYTATDSDSQLVLTVDEVIGGMDFEMESTMPTGEVLVYYTTQAGQDYTEKQRTWAVPVEGRENLYSFTIPVQYVHTLRIDPTIYGGNRLRFGDFVLNPHREFSHFAGFTVPDMAVMTAGAAVLAAILKFVQEFFTKYRDKVYKN